MQSTSKLTKKYQATIPQPAREAISLMPGDSVVFEVTEDKVTLRKATAIDWEYLQFVSETLSEWNSTADDEDWHDIA